MSGPARSDLASLFYDYWLEEGLAEHDRSCMYFVGALMNGSWVEILDTGAEFREWLEASAYWLVWEIYTHPVRNFDGDVDEALTACRVAKELTK